MSLPLEPSNDQPKTKYQPKDAMIVMIAEKLVETTFQSFTAATTPVGTERAVIISRAALAASKLGTKSAILDTLNQHLDEMYAFTISQIRIVPTDDLDIICFIVVK